MKPHLDYRPTLIQSDISLSDRFLTVNNQRFHYIWLRDHCQCPQCYHASAFQKIYDISEQAKSPQPNSARIQDDKLLVEWNGDPPHQSIFPLSWLLGYAYDRNVGDHGTFPHLRLQPNSDKIHWDRDWLQANPQQWPQFGTDRMESWIDQLDTLGFTILRNLPWEALDPLTAAIGPIYKLARNGPYSTVKVEPNAQDLSFEGGALSPHTDLTYLPAPRVVQLLYCVENQATGGESVVVDGYRIAQDFHIHYPHYFQILAETPVQFRHFYSQWNYFVSHTTPILKQDYRGFVSDLYYCHKNFDLDLPFNQVEGFYEAYCAFGRYLNNPSYQYWYRMEPGDCLLVQNFRVLHGRSAFDPNSGPRHLEIAYIEWAYFAGLRDFERAQPWFQAEGTGVEI